MCSVFFCYMKCKLNCSVGKSSKIFLNGNRILKLALSFPYPSSFSVSQGMSLSVRQYSFETHVLSGTLGDNDSLITLPLPEKDRDCLKWFSERRVRWLLYDMFCRYTMNHCNPYYFKLNNRVLFLKWRRL